MKTIHKYTIGVIQNCPVQMPVNAKVLHVDMQNSMLTLWALVDLSNKIENRYFSVYGTGHEILKEGCYIGTVNDGTFVWHIFEDIRD